MRTLTCKHEVRDWVRDWSFGQICVRSSLEVARRSVPYQILGQEDLINFA